MEHTKTHWEEFIWNWKISLEEVSNNVYVVTAIGPKDEQIQARGFNDIDPLICEIVMKILGISPLRDKEKYPELVPFVVDQELYLKDVTYRLDFKI